MFLSFPEGDCKLVEFRSEITAGRKSNWRSVKCFQLRESANHKPQHTVLYTTE